MLDYGFAVKKARKRRKMSLSVYSKDIRNINDNIDIINDKQRKINDTITMIESSINKIKSNCFGSTASVICIRLNNLKSELLNTNSDLSTYKQQSESVVDNFNQGCLGLDLDEVVLKNNLNLLNDKLEIYQSLSLPNNALVENTNEMINRNQDLLYRLNNFETNTYDKLVLSENNNSDSNLDDDLSPFEDFVGGVLNFYFGSWEKLDELFSSSGGKKLIKGFDFVLSGVFDVLFLIPHATEYDWEDNTAGSIINVILDGVIVIGGSWAGSIGGAAVGASVGGAIGSIFPGIGTVGGAAIGSVIGGIIGDILASNAIDGILNYQIPNSVPWIGGKTVDEVIDDVGYEIGDGINYIGTQIGIV